MNHKLLFILLFSLLLHLIFAFTYHLVWWDSGVYVGMGKYLFSSGEAGLWEHIRPPFVPVVLGFFWWLGLDPILFGRLFEIILFLGLVYFTYLLAKDWFSEKIAVWSALFVSLSPVFFYLSFHQYTEIPSVFFTLLALWLLKKKPFLAGISLGFAFLAKFPAGIFFIPIIIFLACDKQWKKLFLSCCGFILILVPYFIASFVAYGGFFATLSAANDAISKVLGCNVLRFKPWWFYFWILIVSETFLYIFSILGIITLIRNWKKHYLLFALCFLIPLVYLLQLHCRDYRYLTFVLPFFAMLASVGIVYLLDFVGKRWRNILLILAGIIMLAFCLFFYVQNEPRSPDSVAEEYFGFLEQKEVNGEIWTANPVVAAYTDKRLEKIYYPVYGSRVLRDFSFYVENHKEKIGAVLIDNCGGGIICPPDEPECESNTEDLMNYLDSNFNKVFDKQKGRCWYRIWIADE